MKRNSLVSLCLIVVFATAGCNLPVASPTPTAGPTAAVTAAVPPASPTTSLALPPSETPLPLTPTLELPTPTLFIPHSLVPSVDVKVGKIINDTTSLGTATEQRAPYGDSYQVGLFERPFTQDMGYVSDLDIASYNQSRDDKFYYVSIQLVGTNPNNPIGINYAVEIDLDADGYGDTIVVAHPPYSAEWTTTNVIVAQDTNRDTGGLSPEKSDAPLPGDGYDTVIFDGSTGLGNDPDLAWVRINAGKYATVQFAFKRALAEEKFMLGVFSDGGMRDIFQLDYVDRLTEEQAGSPIQGNKYYPLKLLFALDNVCREAYGFEGTGEEPHRCPKK